MLSDQVIVLASVLVAQVKAVSGVGVFFREQEY